MIYHSIQPDDCFCLWYLIMNGKQKRKKIKINTKTHPNTGIFNGRNKNAIIYFSCLKKKSNYSFLFKFFEMYRVYKNMYTNFITIFL